MFAAHINERQQEQSAEEHCRAAAAYAAAEGEDLHLSHTMQLAGLLHDLGKCTAAFDTYLRDAHSGKKVKRGSVNHSSAGARFITERFRPQSMEELLTQQLIAYIVMSHHGLNDCLHYDGKDNYTARLYPQADTYQEAVSGGTWLLSEELDTLWKEACQEVSDMAGSIQAIVTQMQTQKPTEERTFLYGCLTRMLLSMLIDADRRDTAAFMDGQPPLCPTEEERTVFFADCAEKLEQKLASFAGEAGNKIIEWRQKMAEECLSFAEHRSASQTGGIYKLPIPTGGGKTFSAMRFALRIAQKERKHRIIYAAPFLSILEQNAEELKKVFGAGENILEYHSNVLRDETDQETLRRQECLAEDWSSPMILTTTVRLLEVLFGGGTTDIRRLHRLKQSVIIIDEAQTIPVRYINLFNTMMNFLAYAAGCIVVLCTATQPIFEKAPRPLLFAQPVSIIAQPEAAAQAFKRTEIIAEDALNRFGTEALVQWMTAHMSGSTLVILNTKAAVRKLYEEMKAWLPPEYKPVQLTTYMCAQHRLDVIKEMKQALDRHEKIFCISTQLIEAGVDISFETVFRSLAGLDSIAQAAGRCNRHGEQSDAGKVYIFSYEEENISALEDIKEGQQAMRDRLYRYQGEDRRAAGADLSPDAIRKYYEQYFYNRSDIMDAPATHYGAEYSDKQSLYSFLSNNLAAKNEFEKNHPGQKFWLPLPQSFKTAAELFRPIEKVNNLSVIVYYGQSKEWIDRLYRTSDRSEKRKLLRLLQRYTVELNARSSLVREWLSRGMLETLPTEEDIYILTEGAYRPDVGVTAEMGDCIV